MPTTLLRDKHIEYILSLQDKQDSPEMLFADHRRLSGVYWAVSALDLLGARDRLDKEAIVNYVMSCYREEEGGFGGHVDQDAHILYTLSALQVLVMYDALNRVDVDAVSRFVGSLQLPDGSFMGSPTSPEVDTRFSYCAILSATLLNRRSVLDLSAAGAFLASCTNFDGGYGCIPDAESHAGQIFCVLAALALLGTPTPPAAAALCEWLASRQLPCGGLNGRPDKKEDVCYSWWVVASLSILGHVGWIDAAALQRFVLGCQDPDAGGVADRVGDLPDVFHTFFGLAALDLLGVGGLGGPSVCAAPPSGGTAARRAGPRLGRGWAGTGIGRGRGHRYRSRGANASCVGAGGRRASRVR